RVGGRDEPGLERGAGPEIGGRAPQTKRGPVRKGWLLSPQGFLNPGLRSASRLILVGTRRLL
ncbi:hypothetical protein P7K49_029174, partial [Saguinus oedipus]